MLKKHEPFTKFFVSNYKIREFMIVVDKDEPQKNGGLILHSVETVVVLHFVVITLVAVALVAVALLLPLHVAEIPREGEVDGAALAPVLLVAREGLAVGLVLPFA